MRDASRRNQPGTHAGPSSEDGSGSAVQVAQQRAQQNLPKSPTVYSCRPSPASKRPSPAVGSLPSLPMTTAPPPSAVIDTNALLDWLVFQDPAATFGQAVERGALRWIATPAMLLEHRRLFASSSLSAWSPDATRLEAAWDRWAHVDTDAVPGGPLRCTDADDQMFIDLALARRTTWLLTRDRALLKLRKRAASNGVRVLTPLDWQLSSGEGVDAMSSQSGSQTRSRRP